jgi:hypothetical protein
MTSCLYSYENVQESNGMDYSSAVYALLTCDLNCAILQLFSISWREWWTSCW